MSHSVSIHGMEMESVYRLLFLYRHCFRCMSMFFFKYCVFVAAAAVAAAASAVDVAVSFDKLLIAVHCAFVCMCARVNVCMRSTIQVEHF